MLSNILSRLLSEITQVLASTLSRILLALDLIWDSDSSPDAYSTLCPILANSLATCNNKVDLPAPGLAERIVTESFIIPPPITRLNSLILVTILWLLLRSISLSLFIGFFLLIELALCFVPLLATIFVSSKLFQLLQPGHLPI